MKIKEKDHNQLVSIPILLVIILGLLYVLVSNNNHSPKITASSGDATLGGTDTPLGICDNFSFQNTMPSPVLVGQNIQHQKIGEFTIANTNPLNCPQWHLLATGAYIDIATSFPVSYINNLTTDVANSTSIKYPANTNNDLSFSIYLTINNPTYTVVSIYADIGAAPIGGTIQVSLLPKGLIYDDNLHPQVILPVSKLSSPLLTVSCVPTMDTLPVSNLSVGSPNGNSSATFNGKLNLCAPQTMNFKYRVKGSGTTSTTAPPITVSTNGANYSQSVTTLTQGTIYEYQACTSGGQCGSWVAFRAPSFNDCGAGNFIISNNLPLNKAAVEKKSNQLIGSWLFKNNCTSFSGKPLNISNLLVGLNTSPFSIPGNLTNLKVNGNNIAVPTASNSYSYSATLNQGDSLILDMYADVAIPLPLNGTIQTTMKPTAEFLNDPQYPTDASPTSASTGQKVTISSCPSSTNISVTTNPATLITAFSAQLNATLGPCAPSTVYFNYFNTFTPSTIIGTTQTLLTTTNTNFSFKPNLAGNQMYKFQACGFTAWNPTKVCGSWLTFQTPKPAL